LVYPEKMIELIDGAAIMAAGVIIGRFLPARRRRPREVIEPVCGCTHHHSFHDPETGECHGEVRGQMRCTCRQYSGPVPLPEAYMPDLAG
jgi:hypothetical protein